MNRNAQFANRLLDGKSLAKEMKRHHFVKYQNGGGNVCWQSTIEAGSPTGFWASLFITDDDGPGVPMQLNDPSPVVLHYEEGGRHGIHAHYARDFKNIRALIAWLDTTEYILPGNGPQPDGWTQREL